MLGLSAERQRDVQVDVALDENAVTVTVTEEREVADLFDENGELRLWEDDAGWSGYVLEDGAHYYVNTRHEYGPDEWVSRQRVQEHTVRTGVERHIRDPKAGGEGVFRRRCSPR